MFEIFMVVGWTLLGILLLYLWADVRELKQELKACRRDLMRNTIGGRTSENYSGFSEEDYWEEARRDQEKEKQGKKKSQSEKNQEQKQEKRKFQNEKNQEQKQKKRDGSQNQDQGSNEPEMWMQEGQGFQDQERKGQAWEGQEPYSGEPEERRKTLSLKPGEEQVLREILMEFLS